VVLKGPTNCLRSHNNGNVVVFSAPPLRSSIKPTKNVRFQEPTSRDQHLQNAKETSRAIARNHQKAPPEPASQCPSLRLTVQPSMANRDTLFSFWFVITINWHSGHCIHRKTKTSFSYSHSQWKLQ